MKRSGFGALFVWALACAIEAQASEREAHGTFTRYCVECHGGTKPKAGLDIAGMVERMSSTAVAERADTWDGIARMLETQQMPPEDADRFPSDAERAGAAGWIRASLDAYE